MGKRFVKKDHPRVCGEQLAWALRARAVRGSPPRVRGTAARHSICTFHSRITPACAGNRCSKPSTPPRLGDHPRVCGEQHPDRFFIGHSPGSPPRVRGTVIKEEKMSKAARITPACAGNSIVPIGCVYAKGDHPRVCGEQLFLARRRTLPPGSPPRVRGTELRCVVQLR